MKPLNRRQVIKTVMFGAAFSNVIGKAWAAPMRYEIRAQSSSQVGLLQVQLSDFPELNAARGSIRLATSPLESDPESDCTVERCDRPSGLFSPVLINRGDQNDFYTMTAECAHAGCTVRKMDPSTKIITCPCHGSRYAMDGKVVGGPAMQSLQVFKFRQSNGMLEIEMPDVFYNIEARRVATQPRVEISFIAFMSITYQIYYRESLDSSVPQLVTFATTPDGPADQTEIPGIDDYVSAYVDRAGKAGFFQVVMKTEAV
jgi:Rieske Fe-S protein